MQDTSFSSSEIFVTDDTLRGWPLPMPDGDADKEERGRILVIGGSRDMPGGVILAAEAALRAGAGKLAIATGASVAQLVALAIPEARVIGLPETAAGGLAASGANEIAELASRADAVLAGPGMQDEASVCGFLLELLPRLDKARLVLDACAMGLVGGKGRIGDDMQNGRFLGRFEARVLLTPHAGEMAHLTGLDKEAVAAAPAQAARQAAQRWNAVVALKGAATFIAAPDGRLWRHEGGNVGLATSGSGDALAGIIGGLAARGAALEQACVWGVALHARAGEQLAARMGPLGYLAREIAQQVPALMHGLRAPALSAQAPGPQVRPGAASAAHDGGEIR